MLNVVAEAVRGVDRQSTEGDETGKEEQGIVARNVFILKDGE
jgi:hypothetical protein